MPKIMEEQLATAHKSISEARLVAPEAKKEERHCGNFKQCCTNFKLCCRKCARGNRKLPPDATWSHICYYYCILCPPIHLPGTVYTFLTVSVFLYGSVWGIFGKEALPGGSPFGMVIVFLCASVGGFAVSKIRPLPPLLGMIMVGIALRNIPYINFAKDVTHHWAAPVRTLALVVILIRAGLGLDWSKLKYMSAGALRLSLIPCLTETLTVAILSHYIFTKYLMDFPWTWSFMLGFVCSAVSPAVIVPAMLLLQLQQLGTNKGIPTLVIAGGSLDDIVAISGFSLVLGLTRTGENLIWNIFKAPTEIVIGIVYGVLAGFLCIFLPPIDHPRLVEMRFIMLFMAGIFAELGLHQLKLSGAGALGVLVLSFVATQGWRIKGWPGKAEKDPLPRYFTNVWLVFQPLLFGLIGAAVDLSVLQWNVIGWGTLVMLSALTLRVLSTYCAVLGVGLNNKERWFVALTWLPKATVQAAIGSLALDWAREHGDPEDKERGLVILQLSVYLILITAPTGATIIALIANKLLTAECVGEMTVDSSQIVKDFDSVHILEHSSSLPAAVLLGIQTPGSKTYEPTNSRNIVNDSQDIELNAHPVNSYSLAPDGEVEMETLEQEIIDDDDFKQFDVGDID